MATSKYLTQLNLASSVSGTSLIHIVNPNDISQNPAGSSYKAPIQSVLDLFQDKYITTASTFNPSNFVLTLDRSDSVQIPFDLSPLSSDTYVFSGSYNPSTGTVTFLNTSGGTFQVNGFATGFTDIKVSAFTNANNVFTIYDTSGNTFSTTLTGLTALTITQNLTANTISAATYLGITGFLPLSGGTVTGNTIFQSGLTANTISAATYLNAPRITGGTYSNGTLSLTSNTGVTINVTGFTFATSGSTIYSVRPSTSNFNTTNSFFVGSNAGSGATLSSGSTFIGLDAGRGAISATSSNFIGVGAGSGSTKAEYSNFFGYQAGQSHTILPPATGINISNFFGYQAGYSSLSGLSNNFFGYQAGYNSNNSYRNDFFGYRAGYNQGANKQNYQDNVFIGKEAGSELSGVTNCIFIGEESGQGNSNNNAGNVGIGYRAAGWNNDGISIGREVSPRSQAVISLGYRSGFGSDTTGCTQSIMIGFTSGANSRGSIQAIFLGLGAGGNATGSTNSIFIGEQSGSVNRNSVINPGNTPGASNSIFIGTRTGNVGTGQTGVGNNNIIIGSSITLSANTTDSLNIGGVIFGKDMSPNATSPTTATTSNGRIGIRVQAPTATVDISGTTGFNQLRLRTEYNPTSSGDTNGNIGDFAWGTTGGTTYFYIKTSGGWKRAQLNSW